MFTVRTGAAVRVSLVALVTFSAGVAATRPARAAYVAQTTYNTQNMVVVSFTYNGKSESAYAGAFQTTLYSSTGTAVSAQLTTYCVDIADELSGQENVNKNAISTLAGGYGGYVGSLYANFAAGATTATQQAALQLAIWETEYDGPNATSSGGVFSLTSAPQAVIEQATTYYTSNKLVTNDVAYLQVVSGQSGQSLVGPSQSSSSYLTPAAAVPEPSSVALLGMALATGLGFAARRRHLTQG